MRLRDGKQFLTGTVDDKLNHIEVILYRLAKAATDKTAVIIPPIPLSFYSNSPSDPVLAKFLFPAVGRVTSGVIQIDSDVASHTIRMELTGGIGSVFTVRNGTHPFELNLQVEAGMLASITIESTRPAVRREVAISALYFQNISDDKVKKLVESMKEKVDARILYNPGQAAEWAED